jgi:hypothetical protein
MEGQSIPPIAASGAMMGHERKSMVRHPATLVSIWDRVILGPSKNGNERRHTTNGTRLGAPALTTRTGKLEFRGRLGD